MNRVPARCPIVDDVSGGLEIVASNRTGPGRGFRNHCRQYPNRNKNNDCEPSGDTRRHTGGRATSGDGLRWMRCDSGYHRNMVIDWGRTHPGYRKRLSPPRFHLRSSGRESAQISRYRHCQPREQPLILPPPAAFPNFADYISRPHSVGGSVETIFDHDRLRCWRDTR
jgi:hypothetical protein